MESTSASPTPTRLKKFLAAFGWLAGLSVFAVLIFAASLYITIRTVFVGRELTVPDVVATSLDEAREQLNRSDLYLEVTSERFDETVPAGAIRAQDPPPGTGIKPHRKVRVSVSLGPLIVEVPDVRGQTLRTAQIALQRGGLTVGHVTYSHEEDVAADLVIAQDPLPDAPGAPDSDAVEESGAVTDGRDEGDARSSSRREDWDGRIDLLVSRGPQDPQWVMPDLAERPIAQVRSFAQRHGLRLGAVRTERVPGTPRGVVIRQYPRAGYPIGKHDIISLVLSE